MAKLILKSIAYYPQALAELPMSHKDLGLIDTDKPYKKLIISTQNRHLYRLVDQQTGQVLKAQKLIRDHNDLKVYVGDVIVVEMKDFFSFQNATTVKAEEEPLYMVDAGEATCISGLISPSEGINLPEMYVLWEPGLPVQTCLNPNAMALIPIAGLAGISGLTTGGAIGISTAVGASIVQSNLSYGTPPVVLPKLIGAVFAGPVIGQTPVGGNIKVSGLKVQAFDVNGNSLGITDVKADGTYELELTNATYKGALVLKVFDPAGDSVTAKYMDEATVKAKAFTTLMASINYQGDATKPVTVNITPLTNLAAAKAGVEETGSGVNAPSAKAIETANKQVAKSFLGTEVLADSPVIPTVNADGSSNLSKANTYDIALTYGIALALLSQIENVESSTGKKTSSAPDLLDPNASGYKTAISYVNQASVNMINSGVDALKIQKMVNDLGNNLATGTVSLSSNAGQSFNLSTSAPDENSKLTATVSNFVDANNTNNANKAFSNPVTYQWQASTDGLTWTNILGDKAKTVDFTLTQSQVGQQVRVLVKNTDETGFDEYLASAATLAVKNVNQDPGGSISIAVNNGGALQQNNMLGITSNTLTDTDGLGSLSYQWQSRTSGGNFVDISGATFNTYTLTQAEVGKEIRLKASYTDGQGTAEAVFSVQTASVANVNDPPLGNVLINGANTPNQSFNQNQTLTATNNLSDPDNNGAAISGLTYQWQSSSNGSAWADISGATNSSFTLTQAEVGKYVQVLAKYADATGVNESKASEITAMIVDVNDAPTGSLTINGTATENQTLTATHTLTDADNNGAAISGMTYQWEQADSATGPWQAIASANVTAFTPGNEQVGKFLRVSVSYTDAAGYNNSQSSTATAAITNVNDAPSGAVTVTGSMAQGTVLQAANSLTDADGMGIVVYKWQRSTDGSTWTDIAGASTDSYTLTQADVGKYVHVRATYTDLHGTTETVDSATGTSVANVNDTPTGSVSITGNLTQGTVLQATNTLDDLDGMGTVTYQWQISSNNIDWTDIATATNSSFTLTQAQTGKYVQVKASYTDLQGTVETVYNDTRSNTTVLDVMEAPVLTLTKANKTFTEANGAAQQANAVSGLFTSVNLSDAENNNIASITLSVSGLQDGANENLVVAGSNLSLVTAAAGTVLNGSVTYSSSVSGSVATVMLTKSGGWTLAEAQTLIAGIGYQNTNTDNPTAGDRTVSLLQLVDNGIISNANDKNTVDFSGANAISATVTVQAVNDAPVLSGSSSPAYTENGAAFNVNPNISVSDVDSTKLVSAKVSITSGYVSGDTLSLPAGLTGLGDISASAFDTGTRTLTLTSTSGATQAEWQTALRAVQFSSSSDTPGTSRSIGFVVNDGFLDSPTVTTTVSVTEVNDAPVNTVTASTLSVTANIATFNLNDIQAVYTPQSITGLSFTDVDAGTGTMSVTLSVSNGSLAHNTRSGVTFTDTNPGSFIASGNKVDLNAWLASSGALTYTPNTGYTGRDSLTMLTSDGGNSGSGGAQADTDSVALTVSDTRAPVLLKSETSSDGISILLTYDEAMDSTNLAAASQYSLNVMDRGSPVIVSVNSVSISGRLVTLGLTQAIQSQQTVNLTYTDPSGDTTATVQDTSGNDALSLTNQAITIKVPDLVQPVVNSGQSFSYNENQTANTVVATVAATDNVGVTGYRFAANNSTTSADTFFTIANDGKISITSAGAAAGAATNDFETGANSFIYAIQATDANNNWSSSVNVTLNVLDVDDTPPTIAFTSETSNNTTNTLAKAGDVITVLFSTSEAVTTPTVTIGGKTATVTSTGGNNYTATYTVLSGDTGATAVVVNATDLAANTGTGNFASNVTMDTTAYTVSVTSETSNNATNTLAKAGNVITVAFTSTDTVTGVTIGGKTATVTNTGGNNYTATYTVLAGDTGATAVVVSAKDTTGNTSTGNLASNVTIDTTAPTVSVTSETSNNSTNTLAKAGDVITVLFSTSEAVATPTVTIGGKTATVTNTGGNNYKATYTVLSGDTGATAVVVNATDLAGNPGTGNLASNVTMDTTAPTVTVTSETSNNATNTLAKAGNVITVAFTSTDTVTGVTIGGKTATVTNTGGNNYTATYTVVAGDTGATAVVVSARDATGNTSTANLASNVTMDTTAPTFFSAATSADGTQVILTYTEALDGINKAATTAFAVNVGGSPSTVSSVSVTGSTVVLTLASAVTNGQAVTVGYNDLSLNDDANAVQDSAGNDAITLASTNVSNIVANIPPSLSTTPVQNTIASTAFSINGSTSNVTAVNVNGNTVELTLVNTVSLASTISLMYTAPSDTNKTIQDSKGNDAASVSTAITVPVGGTYTATVDTLAPTLISAALSTDRTKVILTYSESLYSATPPTPAKFTVTAGADASTFTNQPISSASVSAANPHTVELQLSAAIAITSPFVTVSYLNGTSDPTLGNPTSVQDTTGNDASSYNRLLVPTTNIDTVAPVLRTVTTSSVGGVNKLILTYSEPLNNLSNFTEANGSGTPVSTAVPVFSTATVNAGEASQNITSLVFQVSGLVDGNNEQINLDGSTNIPLVATALATTAITGMTYSIAMSGANNSIATVTLNKTVGITATQAQSLITGPSGISYRNANIDNPTPGVRTFDILSMTDSSAASNATATFIAGSNRSSVLVTATNDGPVYTSNASPSSLTTTKSQSITNAVNISLSGFTVNDPDGGSFLETIGLNGFKDLGLPPNSYDGTYPTSPLNFNFPNKPNSSLVFSGRTSDNTYTLQGTIADLNEWFQQANAITYIPRANTVTGLAGPISLRIKDSSGAFNDPNSFGITLSADSTAPVFKTAVISTEPGNKIILSYNEPLNTTNIPSTTAFTVTGGGVNNTVSAVNVVGSNIVLTTGSPIVSGTTVKYTDPGTTAAIQDSTGNRAITTTVTPSTDTTAPTLASSPLFYNGNWGLNKFVLNFSEELAAASDTSVGFSVNGFSASIIDPIIPDRTTTTPASVAAYQSGSASGSGTCILPVSEKAFSISFNFNSLSTSASLQVKYVDPGTSSALKDLAGNHATNMVLGAWTNDNLSAVDATNFIAGKNVLVVGGLGNDTMTGGAANDTFTWFSGDAGTAGAVDVVKSFVPIASGVGDKLDILKLLSGYTSGTSTLSQWVTSVTTAQTSPAGVTGSTKIVIDVDGSGAGTVTQTIWLEGVNLPAIDPAVLKASGVLIA